MVTVNEGDAFLLYLRVGTVLYVVVEVLEGERARDRRMKCIRFATDNEEAHLLIRTEDYLVKMLENNDGSVRVEMRCHGDNS